MRSGTTVPSKLAETNTLVVSGNHPKLAVQYPGPSKSLQWPTNYVHTTKGDKKLLLDIHQRFFRVCISRDKQHHIFPAIYLIPGLRLLDFHCATEICSGMEGHGVLIHMLIIFDSIAIDRCSTFVSAFFTSLASGGGGTSLQR